MLPYTPDCDYANGEALLTEEKIQQLITSYKKYNLIDYQHEFTDDDSEYYLQNIGTPIRTFITQKQVTFTDLSGTEITVPPGTAWLTSKIDNPTVEKQIDDKTIVAYSISVAEKEDAEYILKQYKQNHLSQKTRNKKLKEIHATLAQKRKNISDINEPEMFSTSLVSFPCVYKAMFCKDSIKKIESDNDEVNKMTEENYNEDSWFKDLSRITKKLRSNKNNPQKKEDDSVNKEEVQTMIEENNKKLTDELTTKMEENNQQLIEALKGNEEEVEETEETGEEVEETIEAQKENNETEETEEKVEETIAGKGDKSYHHEHKMKPSVKSKQPQKQHNSVTMKHRLTTKYNERPLLDDILNGRNGLSTKSLKSFDDIVLDKSIKQSFDNKTFLDLQTPLMKEVYKASFASINEQQTARAILPTNLFATFVTKIIQSEPILDFVTKATGINGKAEYVTLDGSKVETMDGAAPEHYYFDRDPDLSEVDEIVGEFETFPQAIKLNLSDRQRLSNRFGDDLLNAILDIGQKRFQRGVGAARVYSSTSHATSKDIQFRRENGYIAGAGTQLDNSTDFDIDDILGTFDTMFYALPSEARDETQYAFFVPSAVERAYRNYFIRNSVDRRIDFVTQRTQMYYGKIPVIESPTLSNESLMEEWNDGNASMLLLNKDNTILGVGRELGIEPERVAANASNNYYLRGDTAGLAVIPEYNVCATIDGDDYKSIPVNTEKP